jgi:hypothetical protein
MGMRTGKTEKRKTDRAPTPLVAGFVLFLVAMAYLVTASLTRRVAPTFAPTVEARGDTLTVDATDGAAWRYVSLERGRVLSGPDSSGWDLAIKRYNVRVRGRGEIGKWYRYSLLTHLLEPESRVYVVEPVGGRAFKLEIVSYYCPGLTAGCMTLKYSPLGQGD